MPRTILVPFLAALVLLPWAVPPAWPGLHPRAQWSDLLLAAAVAAWLLDRVRRRRPIRLRPLHAAYAVYLFGAALAWLRSAEPGATGLAKLLGIASLIALALLAAEVASRSTGPVWIGHAVAVAAGVTAAAALAGFALFLSGRPTFLVGGYGDLLPGAYARVQAGFVHPNLLASYAIAAMGIAGSSRAALPPRLVTALRLGLGLTVLLTFSRGLLGFAVALAVAGARTPRRRRLAAGVAAAALVAVAALTLRHPALDPTHPAALEWRADPSPRLQALTTSWRTLRAHPLGIGPGGLAGERDGAPFEAHCTPLNVAATLGLPAAAALLAVPALLWRRRGRPLDRSAWGALAGLGLDALAQDVEDFRHLWLLFGWLDGGGRALGTDGVTGRPPPS